MPLPLKTQERKGNNLYRLLLFVFMTFSGMAHATGLFTDTLIVDGEVVYIEPRVRPVNTDSLRNEGKQDLLLPKQPIVWSASLSPLGIDLQRNTWVGGPDSLPYVSKFLGENKYFHASYTANAQAAVFLNNQLGVYAGIGYSKWTCDASRLDVQSLANDTLRIRFENRDGALYEYFRYPVGLGFETDTLQRNVQEQEVALQFLSVPVGIRVFPSGNDKRLAWFVDLGGVWRLRMNNLPDYTITRLNERGTLRNEVLRGGSFKPVVFMAQVRLGLQGQLAKTWYWEFQTCILQFPETTMNATDVLGLRVASWSMQASIGKYFGR